MTSIHQAENHSIQSTARRARLTARSVVMLSIVSAALIAAAGYAHYRRGGFAGDDLDVSASLPLA